MDRVDALIADASATGDAAAVAAALTRAGGMLAPTGLDTEFVNAVVRALRDHGVTYSLEGREGVLQFLADILPAVTTAQLPMLDVPTLGVIAVQLLQRVTTSVPSTPVLSFLCALGTRLRGASETNTVAAVAFNQLVAAARAPPAFDVLTAGLRSTSGVDAPRALLVLDLLTLQFPVLGQTLNTLSNALHNIVFAVRNRRDTTVLPPVARALAQLAVQAAANFTPLAPDPPGSDVDESGYSADDLRDLVVMLPASAPRDLRVFQRVQLVRKDALVKYFLQERAGITASNLRFHPEHFHMVWEGFESQVVCLQFLFGTVAPAARMVRLLALLRYMGSPEGAVQARRSSADAWTYALNTLQYAVFPMFLTGEFARGLHSLQTVQPLVAALAGVAAMVGAATRSPPAARALMASQLGAWVATLCSPVDIKTHPRSSVLLQPLKGTLVNVHKADGSRTVLARLAHCAEAIQATARREWAARSARTTEDRHVTFMGETAGARRGAIQSAERLRALQAIRGEKVARLRLTSRAKGGLNAGGGGAAAPWGALPGAAADDDVLRAAQVAVGDASADDTGVDFTVGEAVDYGAERDDDDHRDFSDEDQGEYGDDDDDGSAMGEGGGAGVGAAADVAEEDPMDALAARLTGAVGLGPSVGFGGVLRIRGWRV